MRNDIKNLEGIEIFLGYLCSSKCNFCYQKDLRYIYKSNLKKEKVLDLLDKAFLKGNRFVIFSGGEPTIDKNLPFYIKYSKKLGFEHIRVHTNGYGFRNFGYLKKLYDNGMTGITISIHGYLDTHDKIAGVKGSFDIIKNAIKNFEILKNIDNSFVFDTNTVVSKDNYKNIPKLINFLCNFSLTRGQIVLTYSLDSFSKDEKVKIIPEYKFIIKYLEKCLKLSYLYNKKFVLENIPFCVIDKKYWPHIIKNIKINKESITIKEGNMGNTNFTWMLSSGKCKDCNMNDICRGLPKDYYEIYGDNCIKPIYD